MATLDYGSVQHWIKLAFKAKQLSAWEAILAAHYHFCNRQKEWYISSVGKQKALSLRHERNTHMLILALLCALVGFYVHGFVGAIVGFLFCLFLCLLLKTGGSHKGGHTMWTSSPDPRDWD
jgi:hypothetical protein